MLGAAGARVVDRQAGGLVDDDRVAVDEQDAVFEMHDALPLAAVARRSPLMQQCNGADLYQALRTINLLPSHLAWLMDA